MTAAIPPRTMTMDVVICAYTLERWGDTLAAVESVRNQTTPPHEIVLVVDHNPDLYERFRAALPDVTVVENRKQRGLSGGKDTGVDITTSDVVAFLDDDAVAHPSGSGTSVMPTSTRTSSRRRHHPAGLGIRAAPMVPGRVRLGSGLHVHRTGAGDGPEPTGWQCVLPP